MNDIYKNEILNDIKGIEDIYIAGHVNPDGDAVASVFSLALYFETLGKRPHVLLECVPKRFDFMYGGEFFISLDEIDVKTAPDVFFAVDCGDRQRLGKAAEVFDNAKLTYCIDHHRTNVGFADKNIINADASSASEIVFELLKGFGYEPEKNIKIATDIYSGIVFDTGGFRHNCTGRRTHEIAGMLVEGGVDTSFIQSKVLFEHTLPQARLFGKALANMQYKDGVTYTTLTLDEMSECGCTSQDLDGIVDFILNLDASECAVLVTQRSENSAKASVRSKKFPIADIVVSLGGGGHALAAGVTLDGSAAEVCDRIVSLITDGLKNG